MPKQARKLSELLEKRDEWRREVGAVFLAARMANTPTPDEAVSGANVTSQTYFAKDILGISQPYLSQIERGERIPSPETLNKLRSVVEGATDANEDQGTAQDKDA